MIVYAIIDLRSSPDHPLGDAVETFVRREDAERFIEEVRGDDPVIAAKLRIEEREFEAGGLNYALLPTRQPSSVRRCATDGAWIVSADDGTLGTASGEAGRSQTGWPERLSRGPGEGAVVPQLSLPPTSSLTVMPLRVRTSVQGDPHLGGCRPSQHRR